MNKKLEHANTYWTEREARKILQAEQQIAPTIDEIAEIYKLNERYALEQMRKIYARGLKYEDLSELEQAQNFKDFTKRAKESGLYTALPDAYKFRADRLTALNRDIWLNAKQTGQQEYTITSKAYGRMIADSWNRRAKEQGRGGNFAQIPAQTLERIMAIRPDGQDFAHSIWRNTDRLAQKTMEVLSSGLQLGKSQQAMTRELSALTGESISNARRIIQTETNYFYNQTALENYKALGLEEYRFVAVLDRKTSETCHAHEGHIFKVAEAVVGDNFPPLHPNCRSGTIGVYKNFDPYTANPRLAREDFDSEPYEYDGRHPATFAGLNTDTTPQPDLNLDFERPQDTAIAQGAITRNLAEYPQVASTISSIDTVGKIKGGAGAEIEPLKIKLGEPEKIDDTHQQITARYSNRIKLRNGINPQLADDIDRAFAEKIRTFLFMKNKGFTNTQIERMAKAFNYGRKGTQTLAFRNGGTPALKLAKKYGELEQKFFTTETENKVREKFFNQIKTTKAKQELIAELKNNIKKGDPILPLEIFKEAMKFENMSKSPYGFSFYNSQNIDWGFKPEGSLRISDHWNFTKDGTKHLRIKGIESDETIHGWKIARYEQGEYVVQKEINPNPKQDLEQYKAELDKHSKALETQTLTSRDIGDLGNMLAFSHRHPDHEMSRYFREELQKELNK